MAIGLPIQEGIAVTGPTQLQKLIASPGIIVTPGVYDCLSARLVETAGFTVTSVSGAALTASILGRPDLGLLTMTEVLERVQRIVECVAIPVIADCETGFGGIHNVMRTVESFEKAGVAGLFIEDQVPQRRCGHFRDKQVIPVTDMIHKIRAAVRARQDPALMIMARTDAREVEGLDSAIDRARRYADAGADSLFVEAPLSTRELMTIAERLSDLHLPLKANMAEGGKTPIHSVTELEEMGYKFAHFPGGCQKVAMKAMQGFLRSLFASGSIDEYFPDRMSTLAERSELLGLNSFYAVETAIAQETSERSRGGAEETPHRE